MVYKNGFIRKTRNSGKTLQGIFLDFRDLMFRNQLQQ